MSENKTVLVVDDEPLARQRLSAMVDKLEGYELAGEAGEAIGALGLIDQNQPDVVLLDISMPVINGVELAHRLADMESPPAVIFCTAHSEYAVEAFHTNAVGYLMKPVRAQQLLERLEKASAVNKLQLKSLEERALSSSAKRHLSVNSHRGVELLEVSKISYFSSEDKYVFAHHENGQTILEKSLKVLEEEFADDFIRVHRNALVSIRHIQALERRSNETFLKLDGTDQQPAVSRRHLKKLKDLMASL